MQDSKAAPHNPAGPAPLRRPGSIRRTSTIDTIWPQGYGEPMLMTGRARDLLTPTEGPPRTLAEGFVEILSTPQREIISIRSAPDLPALQRLVGGRAGGKLRQLIAEVAPEEKAAGTPLYLLLDDYSGASLVAAWAWSRWSDDWMGRARTLAGTSNAGRNGVMEGVCTGFRPGSRALDPQGGGSIATQNCAAVPSLANPEDPLGWHDLPEQEGVGMRRARRIDVFRKDGLVRIEVGFQDSATSPQGGRIAVHEYLATATADPERLELLSLSIDPRILPFGECLDAAPLAQRILGVRLGDLRAKVLELLPGVLGCTHLNDVLRSLAETPQMLKALD